MLDSWFKAIPSVFRRVYGIDEAIFASFVRILWIRRVFLESWNFYIYIFFSFSFLIFVFSFCFVTFPTPHLEMSWWKFCNFLIFPSQFFNFPYYFFFIAVWNFILTVEIFFQFLRNSLAYNSSPLPITARIVYRDDKNRIGFDLLKIFHQRRLFSFL